MQFDEKSSPSCSSAASSDSGVSFFDNVKFSEGKQSAKRNEKIYNNANPFLKSKSMRNDNETTKITIENFINVTKLKPVNADPPENVSKSTKRSKNQKNSPNLSIRSTSISIASIDENAIDSSVIDSDSDYVDDDVQSNYVIRKLGQQKSYPPNSQDIPNLGDGLTVVTQKINGGNGLFGNNNSATGIPRIGNIELTNSTDVTFGDKHFYEGPVTIQQFLIDSRKKASTDGGLDNPILKSDSDIDNRIIGNIEKSNQAPQHIPKPQKFVFNRKAVIVSALIVALTIFLCSSILTWSTVFWNAVPIKKDNISEGSILRIIPRDGWLAQPATSDITKLNLPVQRVIIAHTATENCSTQAACTYRTRFIQTFNIESSDYVDIVYNFLIGGDGNVYEGRGWDYEGAHTKGYNADSICLAFIGTFKSIEPDKKQLNVAKLLLEDGVRQKKLDPNYRLYGSRQLETTTSPGDTLYNIIIKWHHWSAI